MILAASASTLGIPGIFRSKDKRRNYNTGTHTAAAVSVEEDWATPATQQAPAQQQVDPPFVPHLRVTEESNLPARASEDNQHQPYLHPVDGTDGVFDIQDAEDWLNNMVDIDNEWLPHMAEDEASLPTSKATDPHTVQWNIGRDCRCPSHQELYNDWPTLQSLCKL